MVSKPAKIRFWEKVNWIVEGDSCWEWTGAKFRLGYGNFGYEGKTQSAHRVMWKLINGNIPDNLCVLHKCDNRGCVRPNHLYLGTHQDNMDDMIKKKRDNKSYGEKHTSKLTEAKVKQIRHLYTQGYTQQELGKKYNVSYRTIGYIVNRKTWKHVN